MDHSFIAGTNTYTGNIIINADSMDISNAIIRTTATATLRQKTNGTLINLGAADSAGTLGLTDAELDQVTANTVVIGGTNSGAVTVSAAISPANSTTLDIQKGVTFSASGGFASDVTSAAVFEKMNASGAVALNTSATFTATAIGGFVPAVGDTFTVINNLSASATTSNLNGKPEGTTLTIGGVSKAITYIGGTGNDVVLKGPYTALENWRLLHFGSIANSGAGADTNDPAKDGIPNLAKFAFGLNPAQNSTGPLPAAHVSGPNFMVSFTKPAGVTGVTYSAEWSTTLQPGSWTTLPDTYPAEDGYTFTVPIGSNTAMFMRLRVTSP